MGPSALGVRLCGFPEEGPFSPMSPPAAAAAAESSSVIEEVTLDEPLFVMRPEGAAGADDSDADWSTSFVMYVMSLSFVWC